MLVFLVWTLMSCFVCANRSRHLFLAKILSHCHFSSLSVIGLTSSKDNHHFPFSGGYQSCKGSEEAETSSLVYGRWQYKAKETAYNLS
eukprot:c15250_g1_i1 orf=116-379(+)